MPKTGNHQLVCVCSDNCPPFLFHRTESSVAFTIQEEKPLHEADEDLRGGSWGNNSSRKISGIRRDDFLTDRNTCMDWGWKNHTHTQRRGGGAESREGGIWEPDLFFALHTVSLSLFKIPRQDLKDGKRRNKCIMHHDLFSFCFYLCLLSFPPLFSFRTQKNSQRWNVHTYTHMPTFTLTLKLFICFLPAYLTIS